MLKLASVLLLMAIFCAAEPPRYRTLPSAARLRAGRRIAFARQQDAALPPAPAPTGYPEAGVTPEVPFDLPPSSTTTTAKPDIAYLPPDNTDSALASGEHQPDEVYGPPDNTYGPPLPPAATTDEEPAVEPEEEEEPPIKDQAEEEADEEVLVAVKDDGTVIAVSSSFDHNGLTADESNPSRLVYQRFPQARRSPGPVAARLVRVRMTPSAKAQLLQRQIVAAPQPQSFAYSARYQTW